MDFLELAEKRYSVRKFADTPVSEQDLEKILEAGRLAPTARNLQPQKIYVARSPQALAKLREISPCLYGAPLVFIVGYDRNLECYNPDREDHMGQLDADIVQTHMMLEAADLGLGTCWVKMFDPAALRKAFDIPSNIKLSSLMPCGYAAEDCQPGPGHSASRALEEMVTEL